MEGRMRKPLIVQAFGPYIVYPLRSDYVFDCEGGLGDF